jgi:hypothetical protein
MQISLERGDLLQLDPISHTGTVKLLPPGKKNKVHFLLDHFVNFFKPCNLIVSINRIVEAYCWR